MADKSGKNPDLSAIFALFGVIWGHKSITKRQNRGFIMRDTRK